MAIEKTYTVEQVAAELQCHPRTVCRMIRRGQLDAAKPSGRLGFRIYESSLRKLLGLEPYEHFTFEESQDDHRPTTTAAPD